MAEYERDREITFLSFVANIGGNEFSFLSILLLSKTAYPRPDGSVHGVQFCESCRDILLCSEGSPGCGEKDEEGKGDWTSWDLWGCWEY